MRNLILPINLGVRFIWDKICVVAAWFLKVALDFWKEDFWGRIDQNTPWTRRQWYLLIEDLRTVLEGLFIVVVLGMIAWVFTAMQGVKWTIVEIYQRRGK